MKTMNRLCYEMKLRLLKEVKTEMKEKIIEVKMRAARNFLSACVVSLGKACGVNGYPMDIKLNKGALDAITHDYFKLRDYRDIPVLTKDLTRFIETEPEWEDGEWVIKVAHSNLNPGMLFAHGVISEESMAALYYDGMMPLGC